MAWLRNGVLSAFVVCLTFDFVLTGRLCLNCKAVPQPLDCGDVVSCGPHEECYTEKYVTYDGITLFNVGCLDTVNCQHLSRKRAVGDTSVCRKCCNDTDLCSLNGMCGSEAFVSPNGGPLCFSCPYNLEQPDTCHRFTLCGGDHLCGMSTTTNILGTTRYRNGCFSKDECAKLPSTYCCSGRLCNNKRPQRVDGNWGAWGSWGACSVTCGNGHQQRRRTCDNPAPSSNGAQCNGNSTETSACDNDPCPVNGGWSDWGSWGACSLSCGHDNGGVQTRLRTCNNPAPQHGGASCPGADNSNKVCDNKPCPVDGNWGGWGSWGSCSVTCGEGTRARSRSCSNPSPSHQGANCVGLSYDSETCTNSPCKFKPHITYPSGNQTISVTLGSNAQITCTATGNPTPTFVFEFASSGPMPTNMGLDKVKGILNIYNTQKNNEGLYRCWAENSLGMDSVFFYVKGH